MAAKMYGGSSWSSVQAKVARDQKIKGLLNVFGIYDYTSDRMFTHCYRHKTSDQFIDFINRVDSLYDSSSVKQIFLVLDNASIHGSKKTREALKKHPRMVLVFLPTKSPELNLIEVRWMWMQRKAIDNSMFESESDIGKAVSGWIEIYNDMHRNSIRHNLQGALTYAFT